ncbi:MAG: aminotransferase class IV [Pseudonocardia sp.]
MSTLDGASVSAADLQTLANTNYGHYTSMRVTGREIRGLSHHLTRLLRDSKIVFGATLDPDRIWRHIVGTVAEMNGDYSLRVTAFDPDIDLGRPSAAHAPRVLITTRPVGSLPAPPLRAQIRTHQRDLPAVKHIGIFGALHERRAAQIDGFDDVVFSTNEGFISEGATWNVGFFDGENVVWPDADILPGVTMTLLRQVHEKTIVRPVKTSELRDMKAAFATNATVGVQPIIQLGGARFAKNHLIFRTLRSEYLEIPPEVIEPETIQL